MLEFLKEKIKNKLPHHAIVVFSSFIYIVCAMFIGSKDVTVVSLLFLVFLTSIFYHSYPHNAYYRLADWIASVSFILYIGKFVFDYDGSYHLLILTAFLALASWIVSEISYIKDWNKTYNVSHTFWHIASSVIVFLIIVYI
ncbi:MAG: hypothetical protein WCO35_00625 [Candidatus Nomurabacteria bacterium]